MANKKDILLSRASIPFIGEFIKETDCWEVVDPEEISPAIHEQLWSEITGSLKQHYEGIDLQLMLNKIENYVSSKETLFFIYGIRVGGKLLHELQGSSIS